MKKLIGIALLLAGLIVAYGYFRARDLKSDGPLGGMPEIVRIPGGMLEVATIRKRETEKLERPISYGPIKLSFCPEKARIEFTAYYTYRLPLAKVFDAKINGGKLTVSVPRPQASLPVAFDTKTLLKQLDACWIIPGQNSMEDIELDLSRRLERKARDPAYVAFAQNNGARQTVREFVKKWLLSQTEYEKLPRDMPIEIVFNGEAQS